VPDWAFLVPKIAAITLVLIALYAVSILAATGVQAVQAYHDFEWLHTTSLVSPFPMAISAVQLPRWRFSSRPWSPHKFVDWGVMALILIALSYLPRRI